MPSSAAHPAEIERSLDLLRIQLDTVAGVRLEEHRCEDVPALVGLPVGVTNPEVLLLAHVDVVDHGNVGVYRSQVRDGRIYGPGAGDMKGALAVLTTLFTEMHQRHPGISLGLAVTADEESGGHGARHLVAQGLACGVALLPDGGSIDRVVAAEKGILHLDAEWRGVSTHAAYPWEGRNPVDAMLDDLAHLRARFAALANGATAEHWHPTATVTTPLRAPASTSASRLPGPWPRYWRRYAPASARTPWRRRASATNQRR